MLAHNVNGNMTPRTYQPTANVTGSACKS